MISPLAHVDPSAKIGKDVTIMPFAFIDANVEIGDRCVIMPYVSVVNGTRIGTDNKIYQGAVVGADPQDFRWKGVQSYCFIGNGNIIREHVIINRGIASEGGTRIGDNSFIMANAHIGHDTVIEGRDVIGNGATIAGGARIGQCTILSSNAIVHENARVGQWVIIKGGCRVALNVPPFAIFAHNPVEFAGVNAYIMKQKGFSDADIDNVAKCYRHLYQTQTSVFNAVKRIEADIDNCDVKREILDFIRESNNRLVAIPAELMG